MKLKKLENPTNFFFREADNTPDNYRNEINQFIQKLIDVDKCTLCRKEFNSKDRIPRIMIHCGHSFCTACLESFYMYIYLY